MPKKTEGAVVALNGLDTFENWAKAFQRAVTDYFEKHGYTLPPKIRYAAAFTSKGKRGKVRGECWPAICSDDGAYEIFIRCDVDDPKEIAGVIFHELIHAALPPDVKHQAPFKEAGLRLGLNIEQGLVHAMPGKVLQEEILDPILAELGPLPRAKQNFKMFNQDGEEIKPADKAKTQKGRVRQAHCEHESGCGFTIGITRKWMDATDYGLPLCPKHKIALVVDPPKDAEEEEAGPSAQPPDPPPEATEPLSVAAE